MSDPAGTHNDGGLVFGSQILSIDDDNGLQTDYIAASFSLKLPSSWLESENEVGVPNKQVGIAGIPTGSATLLLDDTTTKPPAQFAEFTAVRVGGASVTLIVAEVGDAFEQRGETKVTIEVRKKISS